MVVWFDKNSRIAWSESRDSKKFLRISRNPGKSECKRLKSPSCLSKNKNKFSRKSQNFGNLKRNLATSESVSKKRRNQLVLEISSLKKSGVRVSYPLLSSTKFFSRIWESECSSCFFCWMLSILASFSFVFFLKK